MLGISTHYEVISANDEPITCSGNAPIISQSKHNNLDVTLANGAPNYISAHTKLTVALVSPEDVLRLDTRYHHLLCAQPYTSRTKPVLTSSL